MRFLFWLLVPFGLSANIGIQCIVLPVAYRLQSVYATGKAMYMQLLRLAKLCKALLPVCDWQSFVSKAM